MHLLNIDLTQGSIVPHHLRRSCLNGCSRIGTFRMA